MNDSILIQSLPEKVFKVLINPANITTISQNIGNVKFNSHNLFETGTSYQRVLYSHGIPNPQVVTFVELVHNQRLVTKTTLVGFNVTYEYTLKLTPNGGTLLTVNKSGEGGWDILYPLLIHLLTRPEHDGDHLIRIKAVSEGK